MTTPPANQTVFATEFDAALQREWDDLVDWFEAQCPPDESQPPAPGSLALAEPDAARAITGG